MKYGIEPTIKCLNIFGPSVANIIPQYPTSTKIRVVSYCIKESNFPKLTALNVRCKIMLLKNILAQYKLANGSIGTINFFLNVDEPRHMPHELPVCDYRI